MARFSAILALLGCFALAGCDGGGKGGAVRIALVDGERVFQSSKVAQDGVAFIGDLRARMNERMLDMQKELADRPEDKELEARLQSEFSRLERQFEQDQQKMAGSINTLFSQVVEEYRASRNFELVLPTQMAIAAAPASDITSEVVAMMDQRPIDFAALRTEEPAASPAAAPAAGSSEEGR
ncbi:MAG: OmpH family outer membrane protein [Deltaproteobacteria bacterium]|jgi:Skp family chaperone for outer membrane proteins|nr:OmpH family outer membrane protein [Deltaproteobacteria bacterium]